MSEFLCREISRDSSAYRSAVELRIEVLRKPLGLTREGFEEDGRAFHLGSFVGDNLAAVLLLCPRGDGVIQMRQVAVDPAWRGRGYGAGLVRFAEAFAKEKGFRTMVANARREALGFYLKLGYAAAGEEFIETTIPHRRVEKAIG